MSLLNSLAEFFGGGSDSNKYKKKRHNADEKAKNARNEIENKLILESPLIGDVLDNVLDISWTPVPSTVSDAEYAIDCVIQSPVDPPSHFSHVTSNTSWRVENDSFYTASKVTVSIGVSCTVTNKNHQKVTFTGTPPLLTRGFSNTATLPPTKNVTLTVDPSSRALAGNVRGISQDSQAVLIELVGIALDGNRSQVVSSRTVKTQPGSVGDIHYTFPPNEYMKFSGKEFIVQSQSLREGLQSSSFTESPAVRQAPLLESVTHTLPLFDATNVAIDVTWSPPLHGDSDVQTLICELVVVSSGSVILSQSFETTLSDTVAFDVEELATKAAPNSKLQCRAAYVPSASNVANSAYTVDSNSFVLLPAPTKFSVSYTEDKMSGILSIFWLPLSDLDRYHVQFVDTVSNTVAVSREFNTTDAAHTTTGRYLTSYKLLPSDMNKLQQGHNYSVRIYTLGNDSSQLFSVTPTTLTAVVHYLEEVKNISACTMRKLIQSQLHAHMLQVPNCTSFMCRCSPKKNLLLNLSLLPFLASQHQQTQMLKTI